MEKERDLQSEKVGLLCGAIASFGVILYRVVSKEQKSFWFWLGLSVGLSSAAYGVGYNAAAVWKTM